MSIFYLKHFIHGTKVAISEAEVEYDKTHGWELFDPLVSSTQSPSDEVVTVESEPINPLVKRQYNRKPKE